MWTQRDIAPSAWTDNDRRRARGEVLLEKENDLLDEAEPDEDTARDAVADILHFASANGWDTEAILSAARNNFEAEKSGL